METCPRIAHSRVWPAVLQLCSAFNGPGGHRGVVLSDPLRDGVNASRFTQIGSYDVAVLEATRADALDGWLEKNGFASLPPAGRSIAEQYIREKWSFVVARLRRDGTGLCSPHPLSMSFSANKAVYPMRLTSLSSSPVALDLYCLADYEASAQGLQRKFCDAFTGPKPYTLEFPFSPTQDRYRPNRRATRSDCRRLWKYSGMVVC